MPFLIWYITCENDFAIVILSYFFCFLLLRFKRTWKQSMSFHYWLLLWWRRLKLLFKASQSALNHTDELKFFHGGHIYALDGRLRHPRALEWKFLLKIIGVVDVISWDFFSLSFFLSGTDYAFSFMGSNFPNWFWKQRI